MRIIKGEWEGRTLHSPGGRVRPTAEVVRDRWVTEIGAELKGARVLELYAGTGALGLEAVSRGAARCDFVENGPEALHALKANVAGMRSPGRFRIFRKGAFEFLQGIQEPYDLAFADPPYTSRAVEGLITRWREHPFARLLMIEYPATLAVQASGRRLRIGDTIVLFLRHIEPRPQVREG